MTFESRGKPVHEDSGTLALYSLTRPLHVTFLRDNLTTNGSFLSELSNSYSHTRSMQAATKIFESPRFGASETQRRLLGIGACLGFAVTDNEPLMSLPSWDDPVSESLQSYSRLPISKLGPFISLHQKITKSYDQGGLSNTFTSHTIGDIDIAKSATGKEHITPADYIYEGMGWTLVASYNELRGRIEEEMGVYAQALRYKHLDDI